MCSVSYSTIHAHSSFRKWEKQRRRERATATRVPEPQSTAVNAAGLISETRRKHTGQRQTASFRVMCTDSRREGGGNTASSTVSFASFLYVTKGAPGSRSRPVVPRESMSLMKRSFSTRALYILFLSVAPLCNRRSTRCHRVAIRVCLCVLSSHKFWTTIYTFRYM